MIFFFYLYISIDYNRIMAKMVILMGVEENDYND